MTQNIRGTNAGPEQLKPSKCIVYRHAVGIIVHGNANTITYIVRASIPQEKRT